MPRDEGRELPMNISFHKVISNVNDGYVRIHLRDDRSRRGFASVTMTLENFARALFGEGCTPCLVELTPHLDRVGKRRESKKERVRITGFCLYQENAEACVREAAASFETDGWALMNWEEVRNPMYEEWIGGHRHAWLTFERWVEDDGPHHGS